MESRNFYNEILTDHNLHPVHKEDIPDANLVLEGLNIMLDLIIGKKKEEAVKLAESFLKMIKGNATEEDMDALEEAGALQDISHMPARVKCAVLGWHTMEELLKEEK